MVGPILAAVLALLVAVAVEPPAPGADLDASWSYAIDFASTHRLAFGPEVVFTFGPLAMLYTDLRLPAHDALYLLLAVASTLAIVAAFAVAAHPGRRRYLLLLPVLLANLLFKDAGFFVLPFALLLACCRGGHAGLFRGGILCAIAVVLGWLPLIKGTASVPVVLCIALASVQLLRDRSGWAAAVPAVFVGSLVATWIACGQRSADLPIYFARQAEVAAGYTDAMSTFGDRQPAYLYLAAAAVLFGLLMASGERTRLVRGLGYLGVAFVGFKAGVVREDHAVIAGGTLALLGYLMFLQDPRPRAVLALLVGVAGWAAVSARHAPVDPATDWSRFAERVQSSVRGIVARIAASEEAFADFAAARDRIRTDAALPHNPGSADLYPDRVSSLLASGIDWNPRPVIQSYSAYTPDLAALNAAHVAGEHAPETLYLSIAPIDERYPNLDDGASWPAILSGYDVGALSDGIATLVRTARPHAATVGAPFLQESVPFDTDVRVPADRHAVWAVFHFHPTTSGRLLSLAYKRPKLTIDVTYRDGSRQTARLVAGTAAGGFLLSPTVETARDFVALKSGDPSLLDESEVSSFRLHQGSSIPFWGTGFDVELSPLDIAPDPSADRHLDETLVPGPPFADIKVGGSCALDTVNRRGVAESTTPIAASVIKVEGWARPPADGASPNRGVRLALTEADGRTWYGPAGRVERPDVDAYFDLAAPAHLGYKGRIDLRALHGDLTLHVVQDGDAGPLACPSTTADIVRP